VNTALAELVLPALATLTGTAPPILPINTLAMGLTTVIKITMGMTVLIALALAATTLPPLRIRLAALTVSITTVTVIPT